MDQTAPSSSSSQDILQVLPSSLPNIMDALTPYHLRTLETIHRIYGTSPITKAFCLSLSYHKHNSNSCLSHTIPIFDISTYDMKFFTDKHPIPSPTPFAPDHNAAILPSSCTTVNEGAMVDIIEAIRYTTCIAVTPSLGECTFYPPTAADIQTWLSKKWPERYPSTHGTAQGWRNTVNQCLTHGQGWNFLTFSATDGSKNKRHLLFERAYNESIIIGSGQCKALNDMKPNKRQKQSPVRCMKTIKSDFNVTTRSSDNNIFNASPLLLPTKFNNSSSTWSSESIHSFSDSLVQSSIEYNSSIISSPINCITQPPSMFTDDNSIPTTLIEDSSFISWWDTSMQISMETHSSNLYDTFVESTTINPALLTMTVDYT